MPDPGSIGKRAHDGAGSEAQYLLGPKTHSPLALPQMRG
jgi:hypothetical protein